jgi:predicted MFS family arabinose efflux permease
LRRNPEFAKLWLAQVISLTGDWFNTIVLLGLVNEYSGGSGIAISLFLMFRALPPLFVAPIAGVLLDRFNRKYLLVASNLLRALIVPLYLLANSPDTLWIIYSVTVAQFILSAIFEPGQTAIIPSLMQPDDMVAGNTLFSVTWSVMLAAGAIIGGMFAFFFGANAALLMDAITFAVAGLLIMQIDYRPEKVHKSTKQTRQEAEDTSFLEGLRFIRDTPQMAAALFVKFGQSLGGVDTLLTVFATQIFVYGGRGEISQAILWSALGIGAIMGPLFTNRVNNGTVSHMRHLISGGFVLIVVSFPMLASAPTLWFVALAIMVRTMGGSIGWTYSNVIIQKTAPYSKLGRMFAIDWIGFHVAYAITTLVHGSLIDTLGLERINWIIWGSMLVGLIPALIWFWAVPKLEEKHAPVETIHVSPFKRD